MNSALTFTLLILASMTVARAEVSISKLAFNYYLMNEAMKWGSETCAPYGTSCVTYPCCQYYQRSRIECFSGQCLQAQCGFPGQQCGYEIGECCYHMGLSCVRQQGWTGICSQTGG